MNEIFGLLTLILLPIMMAIAYYEGTKASQKARERYTAIGRQLIDNLPMGYVKARYIVERHIIDTPHNWKDEKERQDYFAALDILRDYESDSKNSESDYEYPEYFESS